MSVLGLILHFVPYLRSALGQWLLEIFHDSCPLAILLYYHCTMHRALEYIQLQR